MDREFGTGYRYTTAYDSSKTEGYEAVDLHRAFKGEKTRVARVIFWDAVGYFFLETFHTDIPLIIAEELIAEAKAKIKI